MEPIELTAEERDYLPPHEARVFARNQPEYRPLPAVILWGSEGRVITRWRLTDEERARLAGGEDLYLEQLTFGGRVQPMRPSIALRDFCPQDV